MSSEETIEARVGLGEGEINYPDLKADIKKLGPLRISQKGNPFELFLMISECACGNPDCCEDVITVHREVGLSKISWVILPEELMAHGSLERYFLWAQIDGPANSSGERQIVEHHIIEELGVPYYEVHDIFCVCSTCAGAMESRDLWRKHLLTTLAINLTELAEGVSDLEDEGRDAAMDWFDGGYKLGGLVGEYFLKERVEGWAQKGLAAEKCLKARTVASGKKSASKRQTRILQMLKRMEEIAAASPDVLRLGGETLAGLAIEDASNGDPALWSQGKGRKTEYLDEIRSDIRYRERYLALFKSA